MFDRALIRGAATAFIRAVNGGNRPYSLEKDGVGVPVEGIWQGLEERDDSPDASDVDRRGYTRYVLKTDPDALPQPTKGATFVADGRRWKVSGDYTREGLFLLWVLTETA